MLIIKEDKIIYNKCLFGKLYFRLPEKEKRIKDYGNVRDNDSSSSSIRSSCLRRYEPRNELRQISYEAKRA